MKKHKQLRMNLQMFAEPQGIQSSEPTNQQQEPQGGQQQNNEPEYITLTREELEREKQREADRRVQQALAKEREKLLAQMREEIERERREAEELAKLSERERQKRELEKEREKLEAEKRAFYRERMKLQAEQELLNRGLPTVFASYILADTADATLEVINELETKWREALEAEINKRLATDVPKVGTGNLAGVKNPFSREHWNLTEQGKLYRENRELYEALKKQAGTKQLWSKR